MGEIRNEKLYSSSLSLYPSGTSQIYISSLAGIALRSLLELSSWFEIWQYLTYFHPIPTLMPASLWWQNLMGDQPASHCIVACGFPTSVHDIASMSLDISINS